MIIAIIVAWVLAVSPHDCHAVIRPLFGVDSDSPIGYGIDGAKITAKCIF